MQDTVITVAVILAMFIGLPVLILRLRDRGGRVGGVIQAIVGVLALLIGLSIAAFALYSVFAPDGAVKGSIRTPLQILLPLALIAFGWKWLRSEGPGIEETPMDFQCAELKASVGQARAKLDWFREQVDRNVEGAFVKFPLQTPNGLTEHIWGYVHGIRHGAFNVSIANDPIDKAQDASGRREVSVGDVEDWQIMHPDGRIKGAYSLIALFAHFEKSGRKLSRKMRRQKAQLIDAPS